MSCGGTYSFRYLFSMSFILLEDSTTECVIYFCSVVPIYLPLQALYQVSVLLVLNFWGKSILHLDNVENPAQVKNTMIFNAFVLCQVSNSFLHPWGIEKECDCQRKRTLNLGSHSNNQFVLE